MIKNENFHKDDFFKINYFLFLPSRAPDFLNKMTFLIGYMKQHGVYDAYSIDKDTGELVYEWRKDKRFKHLANNDKSDIKEYQREKALYISLMNSNKEHGILYNDNGNFRDLNWDPTKDIFDPSQDQLQDAYAMEEINAIKQEVDMTFGYMDEDVKSMFFRKGITSLFGQFKTFSTAVKGVWFLTPDEYDKGKRVHIADEQGRKLYYKPVMNDDGTNGHMEYTTDETDEFGNAYDPVYQWMGTPMEGIMWSLVDLLNVFNPTKMREAWGNPVKQANFIIATG